MSIHRACAVLGRAAAPAHRGGRSRVWPCPQLVLGACAPPPPPTATPATTAAPTTSSPPTTTTKAPDYHRHAHHDTTTTTHHALPHDRPARPPRPADVQAPDAGAAASRIIFWTRCWDVVGLTDAQLDTWRSRGVGGFVCSDQLPLRHRRHVRRSRVTPSSPLSGSAFDLQREIRDTKIVQPRRGAWHQALARRRHEQLLQRHRTLRRLVRRRHVVELGAATGGEPGRAPRSCSASPASRSTRSSTPASPVPPGTLGLELRREHAHRGRRAGPGEGAWRAAHDRSSSGAYPGHRHRRHPPAAARGLVGAGAAGDQRRLERVPERGGHQLLGRHDQRPRVRPHPVHGPRRTTRPRTSSSRRGTPRSRTTSTGCRRCSAVDSRTGPTPRAASTGVRSPGSMPARAPFEAARSPEEVAAQLAAFRKWGTGRRVRRTTRTRHQQLLRLHAVRPGHAGRGHAGHRRHRSRPSATVGSVTRSGATVAISGSATDNFAVRAVRWRTASGASEPRR